MSELMLLKVIARWVSLIKFFHETYIWKAIFGVELNATLQIPILFDCNANSYM